MLCTTYYNLPELVELSLDVSLIYIYKKILRTLGDSGVFLDFKVCIVKATVSWVFEDPSWDSQQGRLRTSSILVRAFWNFKRKVLKYSRNCSFHNTLISNFVKPLTYILSRATTAGKAAKTEILPGFCKIERTGDSHYDGLAFQKSAVAALVPK